MFLFARVLPLVSISAKLDNIWGSKGKILKIYNLTITNAILIKLTTIMYLHDSVNEKPLRAINSVFYRNF